MNRDVKIKTLHSLIRIPLQFGLAWALPVIMTTRYYGSYDFVLNAFNRINSLIEGGSLTAFYVKYSKNKDEGLVSFYTVLLFVLLPILLLFACIIYKFLDTKLNLDFGSYILTVIQSWNILALSYLTKILDARDRTYFIEKYKNIVLFTTLIILVIIVANPIPLMYVLALVVSVQLISTLIIIWRNTMYIRLKKEFIFGYLEYFYNYCRPLYLYLIVSTISLLLGRALLQLINTPEEQSYYALAFKFIAVFLIVIGAGIPILTRNLSRQDDFFLIKTITRKNLRAVALIGLVFGIIIYVVAEPLVLLLGGTEYFESIRVLRFLVFVPALQILNQVLGSFHYSLGITKDYSRLGIVASMLAILWLGLAFLLSKNGVIRFDAVIVAITYTLNQLGRFILLFRSFLKANDLRDRF